MRCVPRGPRMMPRDRAQGPWARARSARWCCLRRWVRGRCCSAPSSTHAPCKRVYHLLQYLSEGPAHGRPMRDARSKLADADTIIPRSLAIALPPVALSSFRRPGRHPARDVVRGRQARCDGLLGCAVRRGAPGGGARRRRSGVPVRRAQTPARGCVAERLGSRCDAICPFFSCELGGVDAVRARVRGSCGAIAVTPLIDKPVRGYPYTDRSAPRLTALSDPTDPSPARGLPQGPARHRRADHSLRPRTAIYERLLRG